jgi:hypothetical protein
MLVKLTSAKTVRAAAAALEATVTADRFGVMHVHDLKETPAMFNVPQLDQVAQEVETTILRIMTEAAG